MSVLKTGPLKIKLSNFIEQKFYEDIMNFEVRLLKICNVKELKTICCSRYLMHPVGAIDGTLTIKTPNFVAQLLSYPWVKKLYNNNSKRLFVFKKVKINTPCEPICEFFNSS